MTAARLTASGGLSLPAVLIDGLDEVEQAIRVRLQIDRGTVVSDVRVGLPWSRWGGYDPAQLGRFGADEVAAEYRLELESVPGVESVLSCTAERDAGGTVVVVARVRIVSGEASAVVELRGPAYPSAGAATWYLVRGGT